MTLPHTDILCASFSTTSNGKDNDYRWSSTLAYATFLASATGNTSEQVQSLYYISPGDYMFQATDANG
jgi:hypothetical protein